MNKDELHALTLKIEQATVAECRTMAVIDAWEALNTGDVFTDAVSEDDYVRVRYDLLALAQQVSEVKVAHQVELADYLRHSEAVASRSAGSNVGIPF